MNKRESRLKQILIALVIVLILRVLVLILMEYRFYFPPDFDQSFFLAGRRPTFAGWYSIGFYTHIISGPIAIVLVITLLATGKSKRFKQLHRWSGRLLALITICAVCPGGIIMATRSQAGPIAGWGFGALAVCTLTSVSLTAVLAIQKQFKSHSVWAWRTGILLCSPIVLRLGAGLFYVTDVESLNTYRFLAWGSWLLPLLIFEGVQRSKPKGKTMTKHMKRAGLTLVELLIVLVVIVVLIGMLLPAVRRVREPAMRITCMNNMRQWSLAALNYESAHMKLPMGVGVKNEDGVLQANPVSGFVSLLPFIESSNQYDEIANPSVINGTEYPAFEASLLDAGYTPWTLENDGLFCPSSIGSTTSKFGRTSYAFSIGDAARNVSEQETLRGTYGYFKANRIGEVTDGTSNTIGMIEIGGSEVETARGGCLVDGKSAWLDKPEQLLTVIKNDRYASGAKLIDRGSHWADGRAGVGLANTILPFNSPSFQVAGSPTADGVYSAGSMHTGGGIVGFVDGSTHFISENIDTGDGSATLTIEQMTEGAPSSHGVWGALGTIGSGEVIEGRNF